MPDPKDLQEIAEKVKAKMDSPAASVEAVVECLADLNLLAGDDAQGTRNAATPRAPRPTPYASTVASAVTRWVILQAVLFAGAVLMALEILAFRIIAPTFGMQLRETSAVIAVFLAAMSVGYYLGGRLGDRRPQATTLMATMGLSGILAALVPLLSSPISETISRSERIPLEFHALIASFLIFFLPALALAATSPIAIRLLARQVEETGRVAGGVSALSSVGSIAGTLGAGFYLINLFQIPTAVYLLAGVMMVMAGLVGVTHRRQGRAAALIALVALLCPPVFAQTEAVVFERQTAYHRIRVVDKDDGWRVLHFDNTWQSAMKRDDPLAQLEYADYFHTVFLFNEDVKDVLFVGLGGASGPKRFLHDYPEVNVDVAEVDPVVVEVAHKYFGLKESPRLHVTTQDGRVFIKRTDKSYDAIFLDAYGTNKYGLSIPFHLTTQEFYKEIARRLKPNGILLYNVAGDFESYSPRLARAMYKTLSSVFPKVYPFSVESSFNTIMVCPKAEMTLTKSQIVAKAKALAKAGKVKLPYFPERAANFYAGPVRTRDVPLLTDNYAPVDALTRGR